VADLKITIWDGYKRGGDDMAITHAVRLDPWQAWDYVFGDIYYSVRVEAAADPSFDQVSITPGTAGDSDLLTEILDHLDGDPVHGGHVIHWRRKRAEALRGGEPGG
jgi:hypothetical protein